MFVLYERKSQRKSAKLYEKVNARNARILTCHFLVKEETLISKICGIHE